ncbi:hypothetical protein [Roseivivax sp. CAU 1761]
MRIVLHSGAHRCATTSFQRYLRAARPGLTEAVIWTPRELRAGLMGEVGHDHETETDRRRLAAAVAEARAGGARLLLASDENMLGTPRHNLQRRALYPQAGRRMARIAAAFGPVARVAIQIRALDAYWASLLAYLVARGAAVPDRDTRAAILGSARSWRQVIEEVAAAVPGAEIVVTCHEGFAARPEALLALLGDGAAPRPARPGQYRANGSPDLAALRALVAERGGDPGRLPAGTGRWRPFDAEAAALLREAHDADLQWLRDGASGLARLVETPEAVRAEPAPAAANKGVET